MKLPVGLDESHAPSLLRAVVACRLNEAGLDCWPAEPLPPTQWDAFSELVTEHRVWSMVAGAIVSGCLPVTSDQTDHATREDDASVLTCLHLDRVLLEIHESFRDSSIDARFFKGAATALRFYPEPGLRPYSDVDVLVTSQHLKPLTNALQALGATRAGDRPWSAFIMPEGWEVDIHPTLRHGPFGASIPTSELFDGTAFVIIGGTKVPTISDSAAFVAACFNAFLPSDVRRLVPLRDVATMIESGLLDERSVIEIAGRWRSSAAVASAVLAASQLFELRPKGPLVAWATEYTPSRRESRWLDAYLDTSPRGGLKQLIVSGSHRKSRLMSVRIRG